MPSDLTIVLLILLGLLSGILGGLLGIGGGVITVPSLYFIFQFTGMLESRVMQVAIGTSLAAGFVTSAISTYFQMKKKGIIFRVVKIIAPGLVVGCIAGSVLAHYMASQILEKIFGSIAILLGVYFCLPKAPHPYISSSPNQTLSIFGLLIGCLSALLGIGGGSLAFPVFLGYQVPVRNCSATSSVATLLTTFVGSISYLFIAWDHPNLPGTFGYIEIPAFIAISLGSMVSAPFGVKLSHSLDVAFIKKIFGFALTLIGISMFVF